MTDTVTSEHRCLIVVSRDHAELSLALSFLRGQGIADRSVMLLPDNLFGDHADALPVPVALYASGEDILRVADQQRPHLVLLCSAYLLPHDGLLTVKPLHALLDGLRDRGCRLVTSDPFLGLASRLRLDQVDPVMVALDQPRLARWIIRLVMAVRGSREGFVRMPGLEPGTHT